MDSIEEKVKRAFFQVFEDLDPSEFSFEKKQPDYERWDSFAHMQLLLALEESTGVTFEIEEAIGIESAGDIVKLILNKTIKSV